MNTRILGVSLFAPAGVRWQPDSLGQPGLATAFHDWPLEPSESGIQAALGAPGKLQYGLRHGDYRPTSLSPNRRRKPLADRAHLPTCPTVKASTCALCLAENRFVQFADVVPPRPWADSADGYENTSQSTFPVLTSWRQIISTSSLSGMISGGGVRRLPSTAQEAERDLLSAVKTTPPWL